MIELNETKLKKIVQNSDKDISAVFQYFISKIQCSPNALCSIGWRDIKPSVGNERSWTFKINGFKGIYGLYFDDSVRNNHWLVGYFGITYFPHPDEKLVECFSLKAAHQSQQTDYFKKIHQFIKHPEMQALYEIARFSLAINSDDAAVILSLYALSRHKIVNIEGVASTQSEPPSYLIEPNGTDQNLPSFVIAYGLFKVLAATVTFCVQQPPGYLRRDKRRGNHFSYSQGQYHNIEPSSWINEIELHLGYGDADFEQQVESCAEGLSETLESATWSNGETYPEFAKKALWWTAHQIDEKQT